MSLLGPLLATLTQSGGDRAVFAPNEPGYTFDGDIKRPVPGGPNAPVVLFEVVGELLSKDDISALSSTRPRVVRHEQDGVEFVLEILRDSRGVSLAIRTATKARPLRDSFRANDPPRAPPPQRELAPPKPRQSKRFRAPVVSDRRTVRAILDGEGNIVDPADAIEQGAAAPRRSLLDPRLDTRQVKIAVVAEASVELTPPGAGEAATADLMKLAREVAREAAREVAREVALEVVLEAAMKATRSLTRTDAEPAHDPRAIPGGASGPHQAALVRLGQRVRSLRAERDLTVEQLAAKASLDAAHLAAVEQGQANATVSTLLAIARAFAVPLEDLLRGV